MPGRVPNSRFPFFQGQGQGGAGNYACGRPRRPPPAIRGPYSYQPSGELFSCRDLCRRQPTGRPLLIVICSPSLSPSTLGRHQFRINRRWRPNLREISQPVKSQNCCLSRDSNPGCSDLESRTLTSSPARLVQMQAINGKRLLGHLYYRERLRPTLFHYTISNVFLAMQY